MSEQPEAEILNPEEIKTVDFYGDEIAGALVRVEGETRIYIPLRPLCDFLGLSWSGQRERTMRDEVLADVVRFVRVTRTNSAGGNPNVLCLPLEFLPGWLFGVSTQRLNKPGIRERIILYRRECYTRLWDTFKYDVLQSLGELPAPAPTRNPLGGAQMAYELATAVQNLAREQMELEARMTKAAQWARTMDNRVTALELRLGTDEPIITQEQAADIVLSVKAVAYALEQKGEKNTYQRVYGELYRQFGLASYKNLPRARFDAVMRWLKDWHEELTA